MRDSREADVNLRSTDVLPIPARTGQLARQQTLGTSAPVLQATMELIVRSQSLTVPVLVVSVPHLMQHVTQEVASAHASLDLSVTEPNVLLRGLAMTRRVCTEVPARRLDSRTSVPVLQTTTEGTASSSHHSVQQLFVTTGAAALTGQRVHALVCPALTAPTVR